MLIGDIVRVNAKRFKDKPAFKDEEKTLTFRQTYERTNALIHALRDMGVKKGDRVALILYNCVEYSELLFALPKAGFVAVTLNYRLVVRELEYLINNSESNTVIYDVEIENTIEELRGRLENVKNYIVVDHRGQSKADALDYEKLIRNYPSTEVSVPADDSDVAYLVYSSGTTGLPKGAMLTHKNIMTNLFNQVFEVKPKEDDKILNLALMYHLAGVNQMMLFFFCGGLSITLRQFDVVAVLETIKAEKPNVLHMVPSMQNMVVNHPDVGKYDLSSTELMIYGASPILRSQLEELIEIFGCDFIQCAGLTEAGGVLVMLRPEDHVVKGPEHIIRRLSSAGREVKLTEVKIVDEEGNEVPPDTRGELIGKGDNVMKGYWKLPEATAETIVDGWIHTGDICLRDEGGYVYYVDRVKDMVCRGGENVYPREIEEVIGTNPSVREVAVIGVPDERLQEEVMAVVVLKRGMKTTAEEIVKLCKKNLAAYKRPRYVEFLDKLPKSEAGKVLKREIKKQYEGVTLPPKIKV
ncbi:long-chain-fatty-acid--CoA ligase [Thermodesulfobacteriota bacterium]